MNQANNNSKSNECAVNKNLVDTIISVKSTDLEQKKQSVSLTIQLVTSSKFAKRRWRTYEFPLL